MSMSFPQVRPPTVEDDEETGDGGDHDHGCSLSKRVSLGGQVDQENLAGHKDCEVRSGNLEERQITYHFTHMWALMSKLNQQAKWRLTLDRGQADSWGRESVRGRRDPAKRDKCGDCGIVRQGGAVKGGRGE